MSLPQISIIKKPIFKFFVVFFLLNFIVINWSEVSWLFNYKFLLRGFSAIFENNSTRAQDELPTSEIIKDLEKFNLTDKEAGPVLFADSSIEIPKIGIASPIVFPKGDSEKDFQAALEKGVLYYPGSVLPGQNGATILLGHSAPPGWPKINYDWIFNNLYQLEPGDEIHINFNEKQYVFVVKEKNFINKGDEISFQDSGNPEKSFLVLLSCWPPGKDIKRIVVVSELANELDRF